MFLKFCLKVSKNFSQNLSFRQYLVKLEGLLDLGKSLKKRSKKFSIFFQSSSMTKMFEEMVLRNSTQSLIWKESQEN